MEASSLRSSFKTVSGGAIAGEETGVGGNAMLGRLADRLTCRSFSLANFSGEKFHRGVGSLGTGDKLHVPHLGPRQSVEYHDVENSRRTA